MGWWWEGPHFKQEYLVLHTSCPLSEPEPYVSAPKMDLRTLGLSCFLMWPHQKVPSSTFHYYLSLSLAY